MNLYFTYLFNTYKQRRGLKVGKAGSCSFSTDICRFLMEKIMGVHNFKFAH